ncbi:hypothetical protein Tco_0229670, partial [Tanacetum coccineum]
GPQLIEVIPRKKDKKVRFAESLTSTEVSLQAIPGMIRFKAHTKNVKSSLNKRNGTVKVNRSASVQNSKKHDNSDYVCIHNDDCMSSDNLCVSNSMNDMKFHAKPKKRKSKKKRFGNQQEKYSLKWDILRDLPVGPSLL